jgi:hypothetical protein
MDAIFDSSWIPIVGDLVPIIAGAKNMICERSQSRLLQARLLGNCCRLSEQFSGNKTFWRKLVREVR